MELDKERTPKETEAGSYFKSSYFITKQFIPQSKTIKRLLSVQDEQDAEDVKACVSACSHACEFSVNEVSAHSQIHAACLCLGGGNELIVAPPLQSRAGHQRVNGKRHASTDNTHTPTH